MAPTQGLSDRLYASFESKVLARQARRKRGSRRSDGSRSSPSWLASADRLGVRSAKALEPEAGDQCDHATSLRMDIHDWFESVSGKGWLWFVKRLSGNDTLLNGSHQAGAYLPKPAAFRLFPSVRDGATNPRAQFAASIDSHDTQALPRLIWYNSKSRDECRMTGWGGGKSPILDPDATGATCVFAFEQESLERDAAVCCIWLCSTIDEEAAVDDRVGVVEPGNGVLYDASGPLAQPFTSLADRSCVLATAEMSPDWLIQFPTAEELVSLSVGRVPGATGRIPDERLLKRRDCEFSLFRSIEDFAVKPRINEGFATVDLFVDFANSVTNRRKARSGLSFELQLSRVFAEEGLPHSRGEISEGNKRPDFIFPSAEAYRDSAFDPLKLRVLGAKTTCKDRWRQVLNEADRVPTKYLVTLQEGITTAQFTEMEDEGVTLVVPKSLHLSYPQQLRPRLLSLRDFIRQTRAACV